MIYPEDAKVLWNGLTPEQRTWIGPHTTTPHPWSPSTVLCRAASAMKEAGLEPVRIGQEALLSNILDSKMAVQTELVAVIYEQLGRNAEGTDEHCEMCAALRCFDNAWKLAQNAAALRGLARIPSSPDRAPPDKPTPEQVEIWVDQILGSFTDNDPELAWKVGQKFPNVLGPWTSYKESAEPYFARHDLEGREVASILWHNDKALAYFLPAPPSKPREDLGPYPTIAVAEIWVDKELRERGFRLVETRR